MDWLDTCVRGTLIVALAGSAACTMDNPAYNDGDTTKETKGEETGEESGEAESEGDGDGDPSSGDGDGDEPVPTTTGDGDGDPGTSSSTSGDGDGDPNSGDGDGDPFPGDGDGDEPIDPCGELGIEQCLGNPACKLSIYDFYEPLGDGYFCWSDYSFECIPAQDCDPFENGDPWFYCNEQLDTWIGLLESECIPDFINDDVLPCDPPFEPTPECG